MSLVDTSTGVGTQTNPASLVYAANVKGSVTDGNGHTSYYTTDPTTGETLSTTEATGTNTTQYQYDFNGILTQITEPPLTQGGQNLVTVDKYDANGSHAIRKEF